MGIDSQQSHFLDGVALLTISSPIGKGAPPRFVLNVTNLGGAPRERKTINWFVKFSSGDFTGGVVSIPPLQKDGSVDLEIGGKLLGFTGDTLLALPVELPSPNLVRYETVYAFHTRPKTWFFLVVVAGILAGIFAALVQLLIQVFS